MTDQYLRNITADYITGVVSACEGIKDSLVLINGPLGCKFYHGYAAGQSVIRPSELWNLRGDLRLKDAMPDRLLRSQYFAGSPQVPGSNLRYEDFIFGTADQLRRALNDIFSERKYSVFTVIQAPGTSLLGEALEELLDDISLEFGIPHLFVEAPKFSEDIFLGYDETMVRLLKLLAFPQGGQSGNADQRRSIENTAGLGTFGQAVKGGRPRVNLFGFYTYERYLEGDLAEITRLLDLCGIEVSCAAGANCSIESFEDIPRADANIFLSSERCFHTEEYLRTVSKAPALEIGYMPVGPDLTERFVREISELLGTDCSRAMEETGRMRAKLFYHIAKHFGAKGFPEDIPYAIEAEASMLYSYADFLTGYLGIRPLALHDLYPARSVCAVYAGEEGSGSFVSRLEALLGQDECRRILSNDISKVKDAVLLGNANTIAHVLAYSGNVFGIETAFPSSGYVNVVPRTYIGCSGALQLLEQLINGVRLLKAWD